MVTKQGMATFSAYQKFMRTAKTADQLPLTSWIASATIPAITRRMDGWQLGQQNWLQDILSRVVNLLSPIEHMEKSAGCISTKHFDDSIIVIYNPNMSLT